MSKLAPVAGAIAGVVLVVGGVVAAQAMSGPDAQPAPVVQPVATSTPSPTTTTVAPSPTVTVAPKPVESTTSAPAPKKVQQKVATVSEPTSDPSPTSTSDPGTGKVVTNPDGSTTIVMTPGQKPPVIPAKTPTAPAS